MQGHHRPRVPVTHSRHCTTKETTPIRKSPSDLTLNTALMHSQRLVRVLLQVLLWAALLARERKRCRRPRKTSMKRVPKPQMPCATIQRLTRTSHGKTWMTWTCLVVFRVKPTQSPRRMRPQQCRPRRASPFRSLICRRLSRIRPTHPVLPPCHPMMS